MEVVRNALSEPNTIESPNLTPVSPAANSHIDETVCVPVEETLSSNEEDTSVDKEMQEGVHHLVVNEDLKLDLPDNLDSEDFSKLLGFDEKHDDVDLFTTQDILEKAIRDTEVNEHEHEQENENGGSKTLPSDLGHKMEIAEENDEVVKELSKELSEEHSGSIPNGDKDNFNGESVPVSSEPSQYIMKEETMSPTRTFFDIENNTASGKISDGKAGSETEAVNDQGGEINQTATATVSENSPSSYPNSDRETPAAILHEKESLIYPKRQDSLTPLMFQQHELKHFTGGSDLATNPVKDGKKRESPALPEEQPTISAYARLDFQSFTFYVQTLHVIIGRRSENDFSHKVDVNLGPSKSISRRHAQIFYNFGTGRFELSIIGKNGAFVDDIFVERGNTVPLKNRTKIQIGQIPFQFALPEHENPEKPEKTPEPSSSAPAKALPKDKDLVKAQDEEKKKSVDSVQKNSAKKQTIKKEKKPAKVPKKVYTLEEIPTEYRTKPTYSYSALLTTCIRKYSSTKGMSLSEIYAGIRELFPYYKYCPDGWQSSVRHNLSLNKSFRKVSKEGKGWLWGLDEEYIAERELLKKKQAEAAAAKAEAAQQRLEQQQQQQRQQAKKISASSNAATAAADRPSAKPTNAKQQNISQTLAANRAADKKSNMDDHQRTMKYLQEQLMILTRDRKGLSKQVIASILTQALAMTINQVTQAARNKGITGNPLTALMDKNPQHLNLILAAAVNAATSKVTNGEVKQLVNLPQTSEISKQVKKPVISPPSKHATASSYGNSAQFIKQPEVKNSNNSFDPSSLSRFFQPRQPARVPVTPLAKPTIPQKRSLEDNDEETSSSEESSESGDDKDDDDDDDDDDGTDDGSNETDSSATSSEEENKEGAVKDDDEDDDNDNESTSGSSGDSESESDTGNTVGERDIE